MIDWNEELNELEFKNYPYKWKINDTFITIDNIESYYDKEINRQIFIILKNEEELCRQF